MTLGRLGETAASEYMQGKGYRILQRNYHGKHGEIDLICRDGDRTVFAEVKTRRMSSSVQCRPASAVNYKKREHILSAVTEYLSRNPTELRIRIDVIEVYVYDGGNEIVHIENAFGI